MPYGTSTPLPLLLMTPSPRKSQFSRMDPSKSLSFLGNPPANETDARFNRTMLTFIQKCGATSKTAEDL
jgi:hypothetical protein